MTLINVDEGIALAAAGNVVRLKTRPDREQAAFATFQAAYEAAEKRSSINTYRAAVEAYDIYKAIAYKQPAPPRGAA